MLILLQQQEPQHYVPEENHTILIIFTLNYGHKPQKVPGDLEIVLRFSNGYFLL